ncbi:hypothetical protein BTR25_23395 [Bacillus sp. MRMR6]|nr:hypothetical protein BTR25_23395 [Bacillus sp. MRMR6]
MMVMVMVCASPIWKDQKRDNNCDGPKKDLGIEDKIDSIDKYKEANQADECSQKHLLLKDPLYL